MRCRPIPPFGDPERDAWGRVLAAIESAMDIEGLQAFDRGGLAELHARAGWHIGLPAAGVPDDWLRPTDRAAARASGGIYDLGPFGVDADTLAALVHQGQILRVEDVERCTDAALLSIHRIGPKRLTAIRKAVGRYRGRPDL
ncbi:MAG: hypothetical protein QOJ63_26 [Solirubrobacteraceae bacterium]|jgi:hypothetical protein|nr:hypothetical protein [Solirubrobacteraceae bacterium]